MPTPTAYIQCVHLAVFPKQEGVFQEKTWLEFVENLTVGTLAVFKTSAITTPLVVNPEVAPSLASTLFEVQSAIEDDFAVELQLFIGKPLGNIKSLCRFSIKQKSALCGILNAFTQALQFVNLRQ